MCDTMVALSNATRDNSIIFAKNSDREPNEPQIMIWVPARTFNKNDKIKCTYVEVESKEFTNETILIKPNWIWGAEMGINAKGVVIGNEAVFAKDESKSKALLGMDMLRLALQFCDTAIEAVEYIIYLLEKYGQGGKASYTQNLSYHNSFIVADYQEAYVLETAGREWAYKKISNIYSISNSYTLKKDYDRKSIGLIENAIKNKWCKTEKDFDFKNCYENKLYSFAAKGDYRQKYTESCLKNNMGKIDLRIILSILRSHCDNDKVKKFKAGSMKSICMHGGGIVSSHTTGSMAVQLKEGNITLWSTGTSLPCISLYKPYWFIKNMEVFFTENQKEEAEEQWRKIEVLHRKVLMGEAADIDLFLNKRDYFQTELLKLAEEAKTEEDKLEVMLYGKKAENELYKILSDNIAKADSKSKRTKANIYYRWYWKKQNKYFVEFEEK